MGDAELSIAGLKISCGGLLCGLSAVTLNQWVAISTIVYMVIQTILLLPKLNCEARRFVAYVKGLVKKFRK